jgi:hypothetical protein
MPEIKRFGGFKLVMFFSGRESAARAHQGCRFRREGPNLQRRGARRHRTEQSVETGSSVNSSTSRGAAGVVE